MTINATATTLSYDGNGSTTVFPVSFQFFGTMGLALKICKPSNRETLFVFFINLLTFDLSDISGLLLAIAIN